MTSTDVEITESIKFFLTLNQQTSPLQYHYAVSNEYINTIITDTTKESTQLPIQLQIIDNYSKVQLGNNHYPPVSYEE